MVLSDHRSKGDVVLASVGYLWSCVEGGCAIEQSISAALDVALLPGGPLLNPEQERRGLITVLYNYRVICFPPFIPCPQDWAHESRW